MAFIPTCGIPVGREKVRERGKIKVYVRAMYGYCFENKMKCGHHQDTHVYVYYH